MVRACAASIAIVVLAAAGCTRPRHHELRGQVVAVDPARQQITIRHEDIRGFMPGMTMPFRVRVPDPPLVDEAGTPRRLSDWKGRVLAVTITYTRCPLPNFRPLMDRNLAAVQDIIERFAFRRDCHPRGSTGAMDARRPADRSEDY